MKHLRLFVAAIAAVFGLSSYAQSWTGDNPANGDFFLYNVGAKKFVSAGDPAAGWGTNAYLTEQATLDFGFTDLGDGTYSLDSRHSNGGTSQYMSESLWVDGAQANSKWTVTATGDANNSFTLSCNGVYMVANAAGTDVETVASADGDNAKWLLLSKATLTAGLAEATPANPMDATFFIQCSTFNRNDTETSYWTCERSGGNFTIAGPNANRGTYGCELWNNTFDIHQTITGLPAGKYELTVDGYGTNGTTYIYAGDIVEAPFKNTASASNFATALDEIGNGSHKGNTTGLFDFTGGDLKIGLKRTSQVGADWTVFDNFRLTYYGAPSDPLEIYKAALQKAVEDAQAIEGTVPAAAYEALAAVVAENNKEYETGDEYSTATDAIKAATENAKALQAPYSRYNDVKAAVLAINADVPTTDPDAQANAATSTEEIEAAVAAVRAALLAALPEMTIPEEGIELTNAIIDNPTVRQNTNYWTAEGTPNTSYSWAKVSNEETEFYQQNFDFYQNLKGLPTGTYEFGVTGFHRAGNHSTYFYAGVDKILIPGVESSVVNSMAQAQTYFDGGNGKVALKFALEDESNDIKIGIVNNDTETDRWTIFRDFTLKYFGTAIDLTEYENRWAEAVAAANAALEDLANANVKGEELTAINAAKADAPENTKASYIEKTDALLAATQAFIAAAPAYNAYVAEKAVAEMIGVNPGEDPTTAADAAAGVNNLKVAEYNYVTAEYPYDYAPVIGTFGEWTGTATVAGEPAEPNYLSNEHWSGTTHAYYEQAANGWGNAGGWTIKYEKTAKLPAGDYMLKVAARSSAGTSSLVSCTATDNEVSLPNVGAASKGIALDGTASFEGDNFANGGTGYGWEWRYLPFTLTETTEVTMTFYAEATTQYQWMSIADGTLLSKQEIQNIVEIAGTDAAAPEAQIATSVITDRKLLAGLNTVIFPFETTAAELGATNVLAYTGTTVEADGLTLNFQEVAAVDGVVTLQANTPYAVFVNENQTEALAFGTKNIAPVEDLRVADANGKFDFVGTYSEFKKGVNSPIVAGKDYIAGDTKFNKASTDHSLKAYRAFLQNVGAFTPTAKIAFNFDGAVVDGIEGVELLNNLSGDIFNLNGQKLQNVQKGINIINGKKVLVK
ncbi:MAG: hypothetical protein IJL54_08685 [Prevotella sp.]|nr:hypothetical protein [Prevotella sp.]